MIKTAQTQPSVFFATCARLLPNDVRVTVEQALPGLGPEDWAIMRQVVEAVKQVYPDAAKRSPTEVLNYVKDCLTAATWTRQAGESKA
jgi:hypothetical protein